GWARAPERRWRCRCSGRRSRCWARWAASPTWAWPRTGRRSDRVRTGFLDAVAFLTRVPVGRGGTGDAPEGAGPGAAGASVDLARAAAWFPVVGAILGAGLLA